MTQPTPVKAHINEQISLPSQQMTNPKIFPEKISKINAEQIELIGMEITFLIPPNLGPIGKVKVDQLVIQKQGDTVLSEQEFMMLVAQSVSSDEAIKLGELEFFSKEAYLGFTTEMQSSIKNEIAKAFATPEFFLQYGLSFQLSDYEAQGILWDVCEKTNIDVGFDVPRKYFIELNLDTKLSQEQSTLVFALTQKSSGVEFYKRTFTIEELEKAL